MKDELLPLLELLLSYGRIHTVEGVRYPQGTHKEALDKLELYLNTNYEMVQDPNGNYRVPKFKSFSREDMLDFGMKCGIAGTLSERHKRDFNNMYYDLVCKYAPK